jgi:hypothetical protein
MASKPSIPKGTRDFHQRGGKTTIYHTNNKEYLEIWFSTHKRLSFEKTRNPNGKIWEEGDRLILRF